MSKYASFKLLQVDLKANGVADIYISNPPMNIITAALFQEFSTIVPILATDKQVRVVVFKSKVPGFFCPHFDLEVLSKVKPQEAGEMHPSHWQLRGFQATGELLRTMPKPTICAISGRCGGGGSELALSTDMRFASSDAIFNQFEVSLGMIPGGSGTVRLARLCGRSRAMEIVLGCGDMTAEEAEKYGWINRVLPTESVLLSYVDALASRIAHFDPGAVARAKRAVLRAEKHVQEDLLAEADDINEQFKADNLVKEGRGRMKRFLEIGGQTVEGENKLGELAAKL